MKRLIFAFALLGIAVGVIIYSTSAIKNALSQLDSALIMAKEAAIAGDQQKAQYYLGEFREKYDLYETSFVCYLRRDMFNCLCNLADTIAVYNTEESKNDLLFEIERARGAIEVIYKSTFRLI